MFSWKKIPPTGHKLFWSDLSGKPQLPDKGVYWFNSGTTSLWFVLKNLNIPRHSQVIIPAYTCPSVAAAVIRSGHRPILLDVSPSTLQYDQTELNHAVSKANAQAVVWVNHFGLNDRIPRLEVPVIIDNAQSEFTTAPVENAVAAIYSFGRGKVLNALQGGSAVIFNREKFINLEEAYSQVSNPGILDEFKFLLKFTVYKIFFHPLLFPLPASMPWLKIGETIYDENFRISVPVRSAQKVIANLQGRYQAIKHHRTKIIQTYQKIMNINRDRYHTFPLDSGFKFPFLLKDGGVRDILKSRLAGLGVALSQLYPVPLNRQDGLMEVLRDKNNYNGAEYISTHLFTLPVNEYITEQQLEHIESVFSEINEI